MEILYLLVPLSVVLVFAIGAAFWWSLKSGQFDDLEGPAQRLLMDDDTPPPRNAEAPEGNAHEADEERGGSA
ncbi:MAG TPA: cbb3-type cytochrome oxidase assembly protein CcoS [Rhodocyclaceae bacterium]|nr:MAG: cytochrome oxidase maturation protein, cbb3-type [Betaproteobacteria bacterium CG2_30_68_42]PJA58212.1 MAG: cbb3-type cytochrome oxidase assembly protein CcoS [Rhodocyclales bacterium CG_4_9_14_3_um_filter_68_10]HCX34102.1 cbb3-type cytochrome oxidase assembly protein CcoS [Rhodocyclaceae bacterium]